MNSRKIKRRENKRRPNTSPKIVRSNIYIACEGAKTERGYINLLNQRYNLKNTNLKLIKRKITKPNPIQVLDDLKQEIKGKFETGDQAWLIIDKDSWTPEQLDTVLKWVNEKKDERKLFISSPSFEL